MANRKWLIANSKFFKTKWVKIPGILILILISLFVLSFLGYTIAFANKIYPNVWLAGEKVSGKNKKQIETSIKQRVRDKSYDKITFGYQDKEWMLKTKDINFQYDIKNTVETVYEIGRKAKFLESLKEQISVLFIPMNLDLVVSFDEPKVKEKIEEIAKDLDIPEKTVSLSQDKNGEIVINPAKEGRKVDQSQTFSTFKKALGNFQNNLSPVVIKIVPRVKGEEEEIKEAKEKFKKMTSDNLVLKWEKEKFTLSPNELQKWAKFLEKPKNDKQGNYVLDLELNESQVFEYLKTIAKEIDQQPQDAKLTIQGGRAVVFRPHQDGYELDQKNALEKIKKSILTKDREISLKVKVTKPTIRTDTINELGIKELIGSGTSNFLKSPENRIHNIKKGAEVFNGVIIKPNEIFSFNQVLGEVSPQKGFLPELVIKEDRLIPETGGGLCQVSTTMFRAALYSGLEIIERQPHAFRVRYYEPPIGFDATIYNPKPDLRFKNDTPSHVLIQANVTSSDLTFEFYGTSDGRKVKIDGPSLYDYTSSGEPVYIDDPDLPQGETKMIERAVQGVTASFNWEVTRGGEVLHKKTFVSKYVPWRAKYKRGTGAPKPPEEPAPSETPPAQPAPQPPAEQPPAEQPQPSQ